METDRRPSIACRVYPCHDLQHGRRPLHFKSNLCTPAIVTNLPNRRLRRQLRRAVRPGGRLWATQHEPRKTASAGISGFLCSTGNSRQNATPPLHRQNRLGQRRRERGTDYQVKTHRMARLKVRARRDWRRAGLCIEAVIGRTIATLQ
jgi:hypothetical protein